MPRSIARGSCGMILLFRRAEPWFTSHASPPGTISKCVQVIRSACAGDRPVRMRSVSVAAKDSPQWTRGQAIVLKGNMAQRYRRPAAASPLAYQAHFRQIDELTKANSGRMDP